MSERIMSDEKLEHEYPGVGRFNYFLGHVAILAVIIGAVIALGPESLVFKVLSLAAMIAGVVLDVMRLRNIGVSEWFAFLRFAPWVGGLLAIGLQSAQTGWIETRRLDRTGWTIVGVHIALFVLFMVLAFLRPGMELAPWVVGWSW